MSLIQVNDLSFSYDGSYEPVFEHVSFQIDTNWKLGFTGRNGRGKTTFLRLLLGEFPYQGTISASVPFSYFPFSVKRPESLAIEAAEKMNPTYEFWRLQREMARLRLDEAMLYRPYATLSGGEQTKLQLAVLFSSENNFLLIDEPTNHLDLQGRELVSRYLDQKHGFLLVSHDRAFLDGCVDHILSINRADIQVSKGNFSTWMENRERQNAFEQRQNEKLLREISRLKETAREKSQWAGTAERRKIGNGQEDKEKNFRSFQGAKAERTMARAKAIEKRRDAAIEEKKGLLKNLERREELKLIQLPFYTQRLAELREISIIYDGRTVCKGFSLSVRAGERIALQGPNGCGKSSILKLLCRQEIPHTGEVGRGSGLRISYVGQDASQLCGRTADFIRERGIDESLFLTILTKLDVPKAQTERDLRALSAGQKKKVLLAASLCERAHLHVWDEPMNYIDVISRIQIEELLLQFRPTILFVEHDRAFCERTATRIVRM